MVFTIEEIKNYLGTKQTIAEALEGLTEHNIVSCITDTIFLNYERNSVNLEKYEAQIGMRKLIEEQETIRRNSNGARGKYWMALSPKWIDEGFMKKNKSKFDIAYWVNYGDNETYGWFSVEDIQKWLANPKLKLCEVGGTNEKTGKHKV